MALTAHLLSGTEHTGPLAMLFALFIGHALADYPLQGKFLAIRKNRHIKSIDYTGDSPPSLWVYCLSAHSLVHAGAVWVITGSALLGFVEFVLHWLIDFAKCEKWTNFHHDQALHIISKVAYVAAGYWMLGWWK
jgi:Protein of unknown function (DUF3307)